MCIEPTLQVSFPPAPGKSYPLYFQPLHTLPQLLQQHHLSPGNCIVITDTHVAQHYLPSLTHLLEAHGWHPHAVVLPPGESTKSLKYLEHIYNEVLPLGIHRQTPVLALGGGVVGDLAGFAAATLLRGLPFVQIPTSLMAQVDSAIGGKTGINHPTGKNLIGHFHQPVFVLTDTSVLQTLPQREWYSGLAEVIKSALIKDATFFDYLEANWPAILNRHPEHISFIVQQTAAIKTDIVSQDEKENHIRALLNFGHTFGHALESITHYRYFTHGEAVILGMRAATFLSGKKHPELPTSRIDSLLTAFPLPHFPETATFNAWIKAMQSDKKRQAAGLRFVLLQAIGKAYISSGLPEKWLQQAWNFMRTY